MSTLVKTIIQVLYIVICIAIVVVSLLTAPPSKEIIDEFESVGK